MKSTGRGPEVDSIQYLRGIAAMSVVIFHISYQIFFMRPTFQFLTSLQSGVDLFFIISGFIMFYSTAGGTNIGPIEFFKRRLIRIAPLYWAATLAMIAVMLWAPYLVKQSILQASHAAASLLFFPTVNPVDHASYTPLVAVGWTLNYEMLFYLFFTIGIALGGGQPRRVFVITALPILVLVSIGFAFITEGMTKFYTDPITLEFVFGMLIAATTRPATSKSIWIPALLALLFSMLFLAPAVSIDYRVLRFGLPSALIVLIALRSQLIHIEPMQLIGNASYSIYISHFFVLSALAQAWRKFGFGTSAGEVVAFYIAGIVSALVVGILCWKYIEMPLSSTVRRLLARRRSAQIPLLYS